MFLYLLALEAVIDGRVEDSILMPYDVRGRLDLPRLPCYKMFQRPNRAISNPLDEENSTHSQDNDDMISVPKLNLLFDPKENSSKEQLIKNKTQAYKNNFGALDVEKAYISLFEVLWYSQLPCVDVKDFTSSTKDQMSVIKRCFWQGMEVNCSSIFQKRPTERGICCSFNAKETNELFRNTTYRKMVSLMQKQDELYSIDDSSIRPKIKSQAGQQKGLQLVLDAHSDKVSFGTIPDNFRGFVSIVDGAADYPLTQRKGFLIRPGRENNVAISAYQVISDNNVRNVDPSKRSCYFEDENPLNMYQNYTYTNCILECAIGFVRKKMLLETGQSCTPWFYPSIDEHVAETCDPWQTQRFIKLVSEVPSKNCSHCLPDCTTTTYQARISTSAFRMCDHTNIGVSSMCNMQDRTMNPPLWSNLVTNEYMAAKGNVPAFAKPSIERQSNMRPLGYKAEQQDTSGRNGADDPNPSYDAFERDIGIVNFYFEKSVILQYKRSSRLTVVDMISQIGGLLGVAMGVSLLSVVELVYWFTIRLLRNGYSTNVVEKQD